MRTDFGLGGADILTLKQARERALEYRHGQAGLNPRSSARQEVPTFEELAQQMHIDRMTIWTNAKHGQQRINTLRDYAFPKIGRMPIEAINQLEVMMCLAPISGLFCVLAQHQARSSDTLGRYCKPLKPSIER